MKANKDYVKSVAEKNKVDEFYNIPSPDKISKSKMPESMDEAKAYSAFWNKVINEFKDDVNQVGFHYQENDKELPLSLGKRVSKAFGSKVKPKTQDGEIKYGEATAESLRVNPKGGLVNLITNKEEWERLNLISKDTETFNAPYVFLPENLCYQVNIPFETISSVNFNSNEFLDESFTKGDKE